MSNNLYTVQSVSEGLTNSLHQYLEAQYHIWDDHLLAERRRLLEKPGVIFQVPALEASPFYAAGRVYSELTIPQAAKEILTFASRIKGVGVYPIPFLHQTRALEEFLGNDKDIIVATGTGSGKTESFLMPILGQLAVELSKNRESAQMTGCRALILYPMNALVNDQLGRLRRLFGNLTLSQELQRQRGRNVRFGMYTSRTPFPGADPKKSHQKLERLFERLFGNVSDETQRLLEAEGKWPAKDLQAFQQNRFRRSDSDRELFTREEMQKECPDILVTNYSMLEYMLLRPIERSIFDQTKDWLHSDPSNKLTVVLDEAHMYRGAAGAEVAMLLRRLQSRLEVDRSKIRYILTSASLGNSDEARSKTLDFAGDLTGLPVSSPKFSLITGVLEQINDARPATLVEAVALAELEIKKIHNHAIDFNEACEQIKRLANKLENSLSATPENEEELRNSVFRLLRSLPPANLLSKKITGNPQKFLGLKDEIFPGYESNEKSLEALIALATFGKRAEDGRVFLPVRLHLFYRGFSGIYACVNPNCNEALKNDQQNDQGKYLGKLFDSPMLRCGCGSRVYELITHRDCGAAYLRGYLRDERGDFLWHEPSGINEDTNNGLLEAHFLVETNRDRANKSAEVWLHRGTGRIERVRPQNESTYLKLSQPRKYTNQNGKQIVSFDGECSVCLAEWQNETKIMDLATKGEAPFAHLVKTQVKLQPPTKFQKEGGHVFPNAGRKTLLFSDGRQKAARLARDIPREIERDVFRQVSLLAASELTKIKKEPRLDHVLYLGFLHVLNQTHLNLFDGEDAKELRKHVSQFSNDYEGDLTLAVEDAANRPIVRQYSAQLLRQLGNGFYSYYALTLAYVVPTTLALKNIKKLVPQFSEEDLKSLSVVWIQRLLNRFGFDSKLSHGVRVSAAGRNSNSWGAPKGFSGRLLKLVEKHFGSIDQVEKAFAENLAEADKGMLFLRPERLKIELALESSWYQCPDCTHVSPVSLRNHCVNCGSASITLAKPENSRYLRARKAFWRDPVARMFSGVETPFNIDVQEHTAQLSYRDHDDPTSTTEEFERRFRDILVNHQDTPIDVLSSTTTMEVGIDIGSLVAVGLRNVPPMRQNYQQRAGRTGRRGSAISTVITYAQNSPYDHHYFENPEKIIAGDPPVSVIDIRNIKIIERHLNAVFLQSFFHNQTAGLNASGNIFDVLGDTWDFYSKDNDFSLSAFKDWILQGERERDIFESIRKWIPDGVDIDPSSVARKFIDALENERNRPVREDDLDAQSKHLIDFMFNKGLFPSYAFPRDLCALQIESEEYDPRLKRSKVKIEERPQQSLNIALSEYAPGRLVVINKKTYRIGSVTASGANTVEDRATPLFADQRRYISCSDCSFTQADTESFVEGQPCPLCGSLHVNVMDVIQPEVVYPEGGGEIDELDDENLFSTVTSAQLPVADRDNEFEQEKTFARGFITSAKNQQLVIVNKGEKTDHGWSGFHVCEKCGKSTTDDQATVTPHDRDYRVETFGRMKPRRCSGRFRRAFLGYSFLSDLLLARISLDAPLINSIANPFTRRPIEFALKSLGDAIVIAASRVLEIDARELNGGFRFLKIGEQSFADLFVYDTLSGGAGYAHMAAQQIDEVLKATSNLLEGCTCQSSCDKCLRHYGNRVSHADLDRHLAIDLLKYFQSGVVPVLPSPAEQAAQLDQLKQMLELEGWNTVTTESIPLEAQKGGRQIQIGSYPALIDPEALPHPLLGDAYLFSAFELKFDLPSAFGRIGGV